MDKDLGLDSNRYSIALIAFFISYVIFEVPSNMILSRTRPSIYLATIMFLWGGVTIGMAFSPNYQALVALRFVMGILESGFAPGILMVLSSWYKKEEQSKRFAVYISAAILSGAFGGILAGSITKGLHDVHGITGWRWLFIVEGAATMVVSVIAAFILPDFPSNTSRRKFNAEEQELAIQRLLDDRQGSGYEEDAKLGHWSALKLSMTNWRTWMFVVGYMVRRSSFSLHHAI
jgi:MFS family permease